MYYFPVTFPHPPPRATRLTIISTLRMHHCNLWLWFASRLSTGSCSPLGRMHLGLPQFHRRPHFITLSQFLLNRFRQCSSQSRALLLEFVRGAKRSRYFVGLARVISVACPFFWLSDFVIGINPIRCFHSRSASSLGHKTHIAHT